MEEVEAMRARMKRSKSNECGFVGACGCVTWSGNAWFRAQHTPPPYSARGVVTSTRLEVGTQAEWGDLVYISVDAWLKPDEEGEGRWRQWRQCEREMKDKWWIRHVILNACYTIRVPSSSFYFSILTLPFVH